jgi:hypothetical protein
MRPRRRPGSRARRGGAGGRSIGMAGRWIRGAAAAEVAWHLAWSGEAGAGRAAARVQFSRRARGLCGRYVKNSEAPLDPVK